MTPNSFHGTLSTDKNKSVSFLKLFLERFYRPWVRWYISKTRKFSYRNINIIVYPGVFHPGLFFSTKILLRFIERKIVKEKKVLEIGAGSGLISVFLASQGAKVMALDINPVAIENIKVNSEMNRSKIIDSNGSISAIESDMFDGAKMEVFDMILVNPPFYIGDPVSLSDYAWYGGKDLEFFTKLFAGLTNHCHENTEVYMILSQDAELKLIKAKANKHNIAFGRVHEEKNVLETNYIFQLSFQPEKK